MQLPNFVYAFLPKYIGNAAVSGVWNLMRRWQCLFGKDFSINAVKNEKSFPNHLEMIQKNNGYIEDQHFYEDMAYGKTTMRYAGCPVFATYNALRHLTGQFDISLPQLIAEFEKDGMVRSGRWGTPPKAIQDYLNRHGFQTELTTDEKKFDDLSERSKSLILTMYNNRNDIRRQIHTIHISKDNGLYTAHNVYCNGQVIGPCNSLQELMDQIHGGNAKGIALIGIL